MDVTGMRIYLSGPMTGCPDFNRAAFADAASRLRELGAYVFDPANYWPHDDRPRGWYMTADIHRLTAGHAGNPGIPIVDMVVMLPGWGNSVGAGIEHSVAVACGIPCVNLLEVVA